MFEKVKNFVREHPYGTAIAVFAGGLLLILLFRPRGGGAQDGQGGFNYAALADAQAAEVAANNQLQSIQVQAQQAAFQTQAAENVAVQEIAAQVAIETLRAQTTGNANAIAGQTAQRIAELQASALETQSTLQASIENSRTQAQIRLAEIEATQFTTLNAQNAAAQQNIVNTLTQQVGVNGIIHTTAANPTEVSLRGEGYTGAFGAGGGTAFLIQKYGYEGAKKWYVDHGVPNHGLA